MKPSPSPPSGNPDKDISALIETLHQTGQRLDELTGGELDSVVDRSGRMFLMRGVQEQLRQAATTRQAAILSALPAHLALLDAQGLIVSVNEAWRRFAIDNALHCPGHAVGMSYLEICDEARGSHAEEAREAASGIRAVLNGTAKSCSLEYSCHSAEEQRWFLMVASPLPGDPPNGAVVMHLNITDRNLAEDAFRLLSLKTERRERMLSTALSSMCDFAQIYDRDGRFLFANQPLLDLWGLTIEEVVGRNFHDLGYPQELAARLQHQLREVFETGKNLTDETPYDSPGGVKGYYEYIFSPVVAADGSVEFVVGSTRDVTERKQTEENLKRFRAAMDSSGDGIVLVDRASMRYIDVNQTLCELVGYTRQELLGMTPMDLFGSERGTLEHDYDEIIADKKSALAKIEGQYRHKDGSLIPVETQRRALHTDKGWIIVGNARDISERRLAAQALRESERRFSGMLASIEMISVMLDTNGRLTYCNDYFLRLTGCLREEVIGRDWFDTFMPPELDDMKPDFKALLAVRPEAWHRENEILTRSGERRLIRWNNSVLRSGAGEIVGTASIGEDITEQKQAEIRIRRLNRVYAVLSGINTLIVRAKDRDELYGEACRIAVEAGHFARAWLGIVDPGTKRLTMVAGHGGEPSFFRSLEVALQEKFLAGRGYVTEALATRLPVIVNDMASDPQIALADWATAGGARSMAMLPLIVAGEAVGVFTLNADATDFFDEEEMKLLVGLAGDISFALDHIKKQERLDYLAYYDGLTGLANRSLFLERVAQHVRSAVKGGHKLALFFVDLERFRNINDSLGRPAGDELLKQVSQWLLKNAGEPNLLAHLGADHFAIVLPEVKREGDVARLLEKRVQALVDHSFLVGETQIRIGCKVGVAVFPNDGTDAETLLRNAEAALKKAQEQGDRIVFYMERMTSKVAGNLTLENQLRRALDQSEFVLHYQPKVNLASGKLTGAEALIRWNDPSTGLVPPGRFIPVLEETGLIHEVGRWALRKAIEDYLRWRAAGLPAVRIAVNVSPLQLRNKGFIAEVARKVSVHADAPAGLELEITESLIMDDVKLSIATLKAVRDMGVTVAIDDFGTGFSSLSYLSKLPVDTLKIDRSFVVDMTVAPEGLALVSTIISLAHSFGLKAVAEGVETEEESHLLRLLKCNEMQGFLFSKPLPGEVFEAKFLAPLPT